MDHSRVAKDILTYVGGPGNIDAAAHCATRLRLVLNDVRRVDQKALDKDPDLKGTFTAGGMFQIIVGPGDVDFVFSEMVAKGDVKEVSKDEAREAGAKKGNPASILIKTIADIFVPILPALIAGGMMMALNNVLTAEGLFGSQSLVQRWPRLGDYANLINMISSGAFAFLPILVGYSSAKRFGGNVYLGAAMGAAMVSTSLLPASSISDETARVNFWNYQATISNAADHWTLFGMHIDKIGYQSMVIPVLCVTWILSVIEKWLHKRLSGTTDFLLTPLTTLLLTGFLAFVVIGPITREMSNWITDGLAWTYNTLGAIGGAFLGMTYSPIVVTGLHQSFPAIELPLIAEMNNGGSGSFIFPIASMANVAQGAAALAVSFKTRDAKMKALAGAGGASAVVGITEPAIFGVNLRLRWPFFIGIGVASLGGAAVALLHIHSQALGAAGFMGFASIVPKDIPKYLFLEATVFILAFSAAFAYGSTRGRASLASAADGENESTLETEVPAGRVAVELPKGANEDFVITSPVQGRAVTLSEVKDQTFSSGMLGPGGAIAPTEGPVVSPIDGEVLVAFPTGHAYGLRSASGVELLIHVGMDTIELGGKYFRPRVKAGETIRRGQVLVDVDWIEVAKAGYETMTPIVVSNAAAFISVSEMLTGDVERGDALYSVESSAEEAPIAITARARSS
ncbi:glucose PTS transporter subunit IIA [Actinomyces massiliensis]|jgi:PTS system sucrose-specific EIIBCA component|uniref:PTS beta-glucoside transporter subunit IIBCA n=1 Tax=Actinomyces massiliensis TaxID=461393 RepID=UPI0028EDEAAE|nr:glucose PTS transporter subunit IIA [Actinomyces massiliensis]